MQNAQNTVQADSSYIQESVNQNDKDNYLVERETIDDTVFTLVGNQEKGYFIAIANYRLTGNYPTRQQALDAVGTLDNSTWKLITDLVITIITIDKKINQKEYLEQDKTN